MYSTTSPRHIHRSEARDLKCVFRGWPLPRVIWYKDRKPIINGSEGFYHSEKKKLLKLDLVTLQSTLNIPSGREEFEGSYTCIAENNIPGWSSRQSSNIRVTYRCK